MWSFMCHQRLLTEFTLFFSHSMASTLLDVAGGFLAACAETRGTTSLHLPKTYTTPEMSLCFISDSDDADDGDGGDDDNTCTTLWIGQAKSMVSDGRSHTPPWFFLLTTESHTEGLARPKPQHSLIWK